MTVTAKVANQITRQSKAYRASTIGKTAEKFAVGGQIPGDCYGYGVTGPLSSDLRLLFLPAEVFSPCS